MEILSPFSKQEEVLPLIKAGARELYCGIVTGEWEKRFTYIGSSNLRHDKAANLSSFKELEQAAKTASRHAVPIFVAFNAHFYSKQQLPLVLEQVKKALSSGASGLIIADPSLIELVKAKFPNATLSLSTGQPCFNSHALQFFKQLGISRVVLPRHLTVGEAAKLAAEAKKLGLETEAFALNAICPFIDGLCTFQHLVEPSQAMPQQPLACRSSFKVTATGSGKRKQVAVAHARIWNNTVSFDCGLCGLPFFLRAGVSSVKIAGRANSLEKKLADLAAVKQAINAAKTLSKRQFTERATGLYFDLYHRSCQCINCYYPTAGKWGK